jgi:Ser/Thr protein kinase RdoA (MazF antagonist)
VLGAPTDAELLDGLQGSLGDGGAPARLLRRRPSEYRTSFPLEELDLEFEDGTRSRLAFKRLDWDGLDEGARLAKPRFLHDPRREPAVYASLLEPAALGAPRYRGAIVEPARERHWLFIEWVEGRELYQVGERQLWEAAARWLRRLHAELGTDPARAASRSHLVDHDAAFYRGWMQRARDFARAGASPARVSAVEWLGERHEAVVEAMAALPRTVIHGEFYASNVLVATDTPSVPRVAPVDWELAGFGPGVTDLAALVSGDWSSEDRAAIVSAYGTVGDVVPEDLEFARLQLAIQWLGWAPAEWAPPAGQRHDWLGEATELAQGLGL